MEHVITGILEGRVAPSRWCRCCVFIQWDDSSPAGLLPPYGTAGRMSVASADMLLATGIATFLQVRKEFKVYRIRADCGRSAFAVLPNDPLIEVLPRLRSITA